MEQIRALGELKEMAASYGFDLSKPAANAQEAVQWVYFGYLGAVKEQVCGVCACFIRLCLQSILVGSDCVCGYVSGVYNKEMNTASLLGMLCV
jgi:hypothetical protein